MLPRYLILGFWGGPIFHPPQFNLGWRFPFFFFSFCYCVPEDTLSFFSFLWFPVPLQICDNDRDIFWKSSFHVPEPKLIPIWRNWWEYPNFPKLSLFYDFTFIYNILYNYCVSFGKNFKFCMYFLFRAHFFLLY
jgi:hypothetical protein